MVLHKFRYGLLLVIVKIDNNNIFYQEMFLTILRDFDVMLENFQRHWEFNMRV